MSRIVALILIAATSVAYAKSISNLVVEVEIVDAAGDIKKSSIRMQDGKCFGTNGPDRIDHSPSTCQDLVGKHKKTLEQIPQTSKRLSLHERRLNVSIKYAGKSWRRTVALFEHSVCDEDDKNCVEPTPSPVRALAVEVLQLNLKAE